MLLRGRGSKVRSFGAGFDHRAKGRGFCRALMGQGLELMKAHYCCEALGTRRRGWQGGGDEAEWGLGLRSAASSDFFPTKARSE